ncbi:LacI family DNA-binding transcriptional regulator [Lederbergia citrea]|uniref:LacI family DNA-binding transcriptional regulator n=1 Tax=Lederbergia citrea TaxID=2833581 RepID=UPI001BC96AF2|nr:LacI family DNA-binding transcriptional regulator [Lederbergia citrea]
MKRLTIKDIAAKSGVSISTVSRVLNRKEEGMSQETREKVLQVIEELNYQPNLFARGLITKQSKLLGLVVPNIQNPFFPELCRGAEDEANRHQYSLIICNSDDNAAKEESYLRLLNEKQVDGILLSSGDNLSVLTEKQLEYGKTPFVLMDRGGDSGKYNSIFVDNEKGGYLAGRHLIELGHRKVACIIGSENLRNSNERLAGFRRAMMEVGMELPDDHIINGEFHIEPAYKQSKEFLENKNVTAIFTCNDLMACGVYQAASELGMKIPDDLSIIGFDDIPLVSALIPKLTTIRQDIYNMGRRAAKMLIDHIEKGENDIVIFEPSIIVRGSTKAI